jgi:lysophospholipase L1-like esterase
LPRKTPLTVLVFIGLISLPLVVPALENYKSLNPSDIPLVWTFPMPREVRERAEPNPEQIRSDRLQAIAPRNLSDPKHELDHFYSALLKGTVRVVHYGDSPTTADLITADTRSLLQKQFGDGGTGFVLIARPWAWYNHRGVDMDSSGWKIDVAGATELKDGLHGLGGASFRGTSGAEARWSLKDGQHRRVEIAYLAQPDGGDFSFEADTTELGSVSTDAETRGPAYASFDLPPGSKRFKLRVTKGSVRLYGADFRKSQAGVVYSSLGVNGANVTLLSRAFNGAHWTYQLHHYKPDLVVLAYGTNESGYPSFVEKTWGPELKLAVARVRAALPEASILLMSPMDRGERSKSGDIHTVPEMPRLVEIESGVASELGVAFFNTFQAMGGPGTMARWYSSEPRLVGADYIHPMPAGAKIVGELLFSALRDGYNEYKLRQLKEQSVVLKTGADPAHSKKEQQTAETGKTKNGAEGDEAQSPDQR